jgi:hypothetical protein
MGEAGCLAKPAWGLARVGDAITGDTELWMMLRAAPFAVELFG